ncbi:hypothetical protein HanRHA438_Chr02g0051601 [Helianthus annuus]|nr:hypothetical protein HanRHA438_Chr02g0051601 [Helianthus annuus]
MELAWRNTIPIDESQVLTMKHVYSPQNYPVSSTLLCSVANIGFGPTVEAHQVFRRRFKPMCLFCLVCFSPKTKTKSFMHLGPTLILYTMEESRVLDPIMSRRVASTNMYEHKTIKIFKVLTRFFQKKYDFFFKAQNQEKTQENQLGFNKESSQTL